MREITPQYLLATDSRSDIHGGRWEFLLERIDQPGRTVESDFERSLFGDRLALLAVIRGLEALPEPSRVLLLTDAVSIHRGFKRNLEAIVRNSDNQRRNPFRNLDLWTRVARAKQFHQIRIRSLKPLRSQLESNSQGIRQAEILKVFSEIDTQDVSEQLVA